MIYKKLKFALFLGGVLLFTFLTYSGTAPLTLIKEPTLKIRITVPVPPSFIPDKYRYEGSDCMELMEIFKYEPPVKMVQLASGKKIRFTENEAFKVYYKFPNQKNVPDMFNENDIVEITRKIHGTNARYAILKKPKTTIIDKLKSRLYSKFGIGGDKWKWCEYEFYVGSHNVLKDIQSL